MRRKGMDDDDMSNMTIMALPHIVGKNDVIVEIVNENQNGGRPGYVTGTVYIYI